MLILSPQRIEVGASRQDEHQKLIGPSRRLAPARGLYVSRNGIPTYLARPTDPLQLPLKGESFGAMIHQFRLLRGRAFTMNLERPHVHSGDLPLR
jgi:hypothetical protein